MGGLKGRERQSKLTSASEKDKSWEVLGKTNLQKTKWLNAFELKHTPFVDAVFTTLRNKDTKTAEFATATHDISMLLVGEALNLVPYRAESITTPLNARIAGLRMSTQICGVPIIRAGLPMADALRSYMPSATIGHVVIQRDERTAKPKFLLDKLPNLRSDLTVILLDPMLATGGSALAAIEHVLQKGVSEKQIMFTNIISCPEGISAVTKRHPQVTLVTGWIDKGLNKIAYIVPGLGDFGDRYWGT